MTDHSPARPTGDDRAGQDAARPGIARPDLAGSEAITQACVHLDAAAQQLEAAAGGDVFSPLLGLAGQLALIRAGIDPAIRAAIDPDDPVGPAQHVDRALALLDSVPAWAGPADLIVWTVRLAELRPTIQTSPAARS